uniref:Peptidase M12B domain-containing protein n=1 Tax=Ciona savignyi TaxID=51511 RepID=H2YTT2_CIOSA
DETLTYPVQVDSDGRFLSHNVRFSSPRLKPGSRRKRDASTTRRVYYKLAVENRELTVNLSRNHKLVRPNFIIERIRDAKLGKTMPVMEEENKSPASRSSITVGSERSCHFRGHVTGHPHSSVAISTCNGLTGFIRFNDTEYLIEPTGQVARTVEGARKMQHRIYKRDAGGREARTASWQTPNTRQRWERRRSKASPFRRSKRSFSLEHWVEMMLVVDSKMVHYHGKNIETYVLTIVNMVSELFHDVSIGNALHISLIRLVLLEGDEKGLKITQHAEKTLDSFCRWAKRMNPKNDNHASHHDVAVLLTRRNICSRSNKSCETLGLAHVAGMCQSHRSCNVNQDTGLSLAFTVAHELGHKPNYFPKLFEGLIIYRNCFKGLINYISSRGLFYLNLVKVVKTWASRIFVKKTVKIFTTYTIYYSRVWINLELFLSFAMHHDGQFNSCKPDETSPRVMTPHLTSNNLPMQWSTCSREYITRFLDRNWGFCLMDPPSPSLTPFPYPSELPGVLYGADHQCKLMFGPKSRHCKGLDDMCNRLWCLYRGSCRSRLHSAVEGTKCGRGRWCFGGRCVRVGERPSAVDGQWNSWSSWSRCSRSCGAGITSSERHCDKPVPRHGGSYCLGERKRYRTCNKWACGKTNSTASFREQQCAAFNDVPYKNKTYSWLPVNSAVYPCELHCYTRAGKTPFADRLRDKVVDGTKCYNRGRDICVDGICKSLGCDLMIDSPAQEDRCGVCRGDGSTCEPVDNIFDMKRGEQYVEAGILPKGARNIEVSEVLPSNNFLALKSVVDDNEYYLNGGYMIQWNSDFELAGSTFSYERVNSTQDNITAQGYALWARVMQYTLHFGAFTLFTNYFLSQILFVEDNPGIHISYMMPFNVTAVFEEGKPQFEWMMQQWSSCSRTCGRGIQMSVAICVERKAGFVEEDFCDESSRPDDNRRFCDMGSCPPEWLTGPWQPCPISCGGRQQGIQSRNVLCVQSISDDEQVVLNRSQCAEPEPKSRRTCPPSSLHPCPAWRAGPWRNCSRPCNGGRRSRSVLCVTYIRNDVIKAPNDVTPIEEDLIQVEDIDASKSDRSRRTFSKTLTSTSTTTTCATPTTGRQRRKNATCLLARCPQGNCELKVLAQGRARCFRSPLDLSPAGLLSPNKSFSDPLMLVRTSLRRTLDVESDGFDVSDERRHRQPIPTRLSTIPTNSTADELDVHSGSGDSPGSVGATATTPLTSESNATFSASGSGNSDDASSGVHHTTDTLTSISATTVHILTSPEPTAPSIKARWLTGVWGQCSTSCGVGAQIRSVECSGAVGDCDNLPVPRPAQRCNVRPCAMWVQGEWSKCSRSCGVGMKHRKLQCRDSATGEMMRPYHCNSVPRLPLVNRTCDLQRCLPWKTSRWTTCNVTCGPGYQRRRTACSRSGMCDSRQKPVAIKPCLLKVCVEWRTLPWERCSVNCGNGLRHRRTECVEKRTSVPSDSCNVKLKPRTHKKCYKGPCRVTDFGYSCSGDRLKPQFCTVLKQWGKCVQPSLAIQCCSTCH